MGKIRLKPIIPSYPFRSEVVLVTAPKICSLISILEVRYIVSFTVIPVKYCQNSLRNMVLLGISGVGRGSLGGLGPPPILAA